MSPVKNSVQKSLVLISLAIATGPGGSIALAGVRDSGGGNAVVCMSSLAQADQIRTAGFVDDTLLDQVTSVEAYDLYETQLVQGGSNQGIVVPNDPSHFQTYANQIANRFRAYVPAVSQIIDTHSARLRSVLWVRPLCLHGSL